MVGDVTHWLVDYCFGSFWDFSHRFVERDGTIFGGKSVAKGIDQVCQT